MKIDDEALPIHEDAELKIRPRIFLERQLLRGPQARHARAGDELDSGDTDPGHPDRRARCSSTRCSARCKLRHAQGPPEAAGRATARRSAGEPKPGEDDDQDPDTQGETAGKSLNDSLEDAPEALRGTAIVNEALLGTERRATCPS